MVRLFRGFLLVVLFSVNLFTQPFEIDFPDPEIKKIINELVYKISESQPANDIYNRFDWGKYYIKNFNNYDCFNNIHKGEIIFFQNKKNYPDTVAGIVIEKNNGKIISYGISLTLDLNYLINRVEKEKHEFNKKCLGH
jgi:hypothetical protein